MTRRPRKAATTHTDCAPNAELSRAANANNLEGSERSAPPAATVIITDPCGEPATT